MALAVIDASITSIKLQHAGAMRVASLSRHVLGSQVPVASYGTRTTRSGISGSVHSGIHPYEFRRPEAPLCIAALATAFAGAATRRKHRSSALGARRTRIFTTCAVAAGIEHVARVAVDGDVVLVHYEGRLEDGTVFDSSKGRDPLSVALGRQQVVLGFEAAVRGLKIGDAKTVTLPPHLAYGSHNAELVLTFDAAKAPGGIRVGDKVNLGSSGHQIPATVVNVAENGSVTVDANLPLAGQTLVFDIEVVGFRELLAPLEAPDGFAIATFAAGCFWGVELAFQRVTGVVSTSVGYAQGQQEAPTYDQVCSATTGHTEAVRVVYNPHEVSFESLLDTFWERVGANATTQNLAGNDSGPQYRSGIYFHNEEQRQLAAASVAALTQRLGEPVVTEVESAEPFWLAEDSHQQYLERGGRGGNPQSAEKGCGDTIRCYG